MKISSVVDIVRGKLVYKPSISYISRIITTLSKVSHGDLFISNDDEEINEAIQKGAYGIITSTDVKSSDVEIAWIQVEEILIACVKLVRFMLSNIKLQSYYCNTAHYNILRKLSPDKKKYIFIDNPFLFIERIHTLTNDTIILSQSKILLEIIYPNSIPFPKCNYEGFISNVTKHSLFESTFSYKGNLYSRIKLPFIYVNYLIDVITFYANYKIDYSKIRNINCMRPIFINKKNTIVEFGKSNKFILSSTDDYISKLDEKFIKSFFTYAVTEFYNVNNLDHLDIYNLIQKSNANCIYLKNISYDQLELLLNKNALPKDVLF